MENEVGLTSSPQSPLDTAFTRQSVMAVNADEPIARRFLVDELLPSVMLLLVTAIYVVSLVSVSRLLAPSLPYWILSAVFQ